MLASAQTKKAIPFDLPGRDCVRPGFIQFDRSQRREPLLFRSLFELNGRNVLDAADDSPDIHTKPRMKAWSISTGHLLLERLELLRINDVEHVFGDHAVPSPRRRHKPPRLRELTVSDGGMELMNGIAKVLRHVTIPDAQGPGRRPRMIAGVDPTVRRQVHELLGREVAVLFDASAPEMRNPFRRNLPCREIQIEVPNYVLTVRFSSKGRHRFFNMRSRLATSGFSRGAHGRTGRRRLHSFVRPHPPTASPRC